MKIEHHYDFGSPNCYFTQKVIPEIEARTGASFEQVPVLLGGIFRSTGNQPPMMAFKDVKGKMAYYQAQTARFMKRHGITSFAMNPNFPVNTIMLMRGATYARDKDWYADYIAMGYAAMWEKGLKMDDPEVYGNALADAGLPADEIGAAIQDQAVKDALAATTAASVERGNFGAPTIFVDDEMFFGKDALWEVELEIKG